MAPKGLDLNDQRNADGGRRIDDLEGAPWPVRAIAIIGGMTCIACFLVWFLATTVTTALGDIKTSTAPIADHAKTSEKIGGVIETLERDHRESNRRLERLLEIMCWQAAKNEAQRGRCLGDR